MQVDDTLNLFNELQALQQSVAAKTKTLHDACDRLYTIIYFDNNKLIKKIYKLKILD
ncbi:hypothetical protein KSP40_PGU016616 [Platanthera guangdongensis]|uniref:Uncharacterized protein n=1 Tax=Platanthera guangdongensis TaxID=2320717 RepID=A0ABR2MEN0_9ASPA